MYCWSFPGGSGRKESACNVGDPGSVPGLGRSPGEGNGYPLQYTCLENSMDRGASQATIHGVTKSQCIGYHVICIQRQFYLFCFNLDTIYFFFFFDSWVRKIPWRRKWQPTPEFLPGEFHGQGACWVTGHGIAKSWT